MNQEWSRLHTQLLHSDLIRFCSHQISLGDNLSGNCISSLMHNLIEITTTQNHIYFALVSVFSGVLVKVRCLDVKTHWGSHTAATHARTHMRAHTLVYDLIEQNHVSLYTRRQHECENGKSCSMKVDLELRPELSPSIEVCKFKLTRLSIVAMSKGNAV